MQLELSEARLQRDEAEMRQQVQQEQQEQDTPPESGDADLLKLQVEQLTAQLAAQTQRADAAEEEVAMIRRRAREGEQCASGGRVGVGFLRLEIERDKRNRGRGDAMLLLSCVWVGYRYRRRRWHQGQGRRGKEG